MCGVSRLHQILGSLFGKLYQGLVVDDCLNARGMRCDNINMGYLPTSGFSCDEEFVFASMSFLMKVWKDNRWDREATKVFLWTLWYLLKNRNSLLFEGIIYDGKKVVEKQ